MAVKEEYRLQALLGIRTRKKEAAERYLADCIKLLQEERKRLRELEDELERMITKRRDKMREYAEKQMRGEMSAQEAVTANLYVERLKEEEERQQASIDAQKGVVAQREEEVAGAREDLRSAMQELEAIEKHKEKWAGEVKKVRETREENNMDEIAQTIFRNQNK